MRTIAIALSLTLFAAAAVAQKAPAQKLYTSASDVQALIAKAKAERKDQPTIAQQLLGLAPYNVNLEYRASVGPAAIHEKEAEMFYVVDGSATMITGGKLVNEKRNGDNLGGTAVEGGNAREIGKGDFIMVPENTAHWFSKINGVLVLMSFHGPHPVMGMAGH
jgi:mannose-6-phosphate isomerase-like protein (cupin superfamily)